MATSQFAPKTAVRPPRRPDQLNGVGGRMDPQDKFGNAAVRDWIAQDHIGPYDSRFRAPEALGENFQVDRGQLTFDAEGTEGGRFHTREPHIPGVGASGLTIGRGYDIGQHSASQATTALTNAGLSTEQADAYAGAAGKTRGGAQQWLNNNGAELDEITPEQQKALFETTYQEMQDDVQRISDKPGVVSRYGELDLDEVDPAIRDILVDLRYRGDYTPNSRGGVQGLAASDDLEGLAAQMADRDAWSNVPNDRFERRRDYLQEAVEERRIEDALSPSFVIPGTEHAGPQ